MTIDHARAHSDGYADPHADAYVADAYADASADAYGECLEGSLKIKFVSRPLLNSSAKISTCGGHRM
jgi:hypothetical protein